MKFQLRSSQIKTLSICATNFFLVAGDFGPDPPTQLQIEKSKNFPARIRFLSPIQQAELQSRLSKVTLVGRTGQNKILICNENLTLHSFIVDVKIFCARTPSNGSEHSMVCARDVCKKKILISSINECKVGFALQIKISFQPVRPTRVTFDICV